MKNTSQRKGLAMGDSLTLYKCGGMVGRPPKKYKVETNDTKLKCGGPVKKGVHK